MGRGEVRGQFAVISALFCQERGADFVEDCFSSKGTHAEGILCAERFVILYKKKNGFPAMALKNIGKQNFFGGKIERKQESVSKKYTFLK